MKKRARSIEAGQKGPTSQTITWQDLPQLIERAVGVFARWAEKVAPHVPAMMIWLEAAPRHADVIDAGWVPHRLLLSALSSEILAEDISPLLDRFSREHWPSIAEGLSEAVAACDLDGEAKATFAEALAAHESGLYRAVCRLLFPEIERLVKIELVGNILAATASVHDLQGLIDQQSITQLVAEATPENVALASFTTRHLYLPVRTEEALAMFKDSPIPNRHACIHGIISYNSHQNSINTLLMAEYAFGAISAYKTAKRPIAD